MIELNDLAQATEAGLNANALGLLFKIYADGGNYKKYDCYKDKRYINGVMQEISSIVVPAQGLKVATQSVRLEVVAYYGFEDPEPVLKTVRSVLDNFFQSSVVQVITDASERSYTVGVNYTLADTGTVANRPQIGPSISYTAMISYSFIENGLNSMDFHFKLDGAPLSYTSASITRVPVMDGNAYSDTAGNAKNFAASSALSFDLKLPAIDTADPASRTIIGYILSGGMNETHTLDVDLNGAVSTYTVVFGQTDIALDGVQNAGHSVSFVEAAKAVENG